MEKKYTLEQVFNMLGSGPFYEWYCEDYENWLNWVEEVDGKSYEERKRELMEDLAYYL